MANYGECCRTSAFSEFEESFDAPCGSCELNTLDFVHTLRSVRPPLPWNLLIPSFPRKRESRNLTGMLHPPTAFWAPARLTIRQGDVLPRERRQGVAFKTSSVHALRKTSTQLGAAGT